MKRIILLCMVIFAFPIPAFASAEDHSADMVDVLYAQNGGNTIISGFSIDSVMSMLLEGTDGETKVQIEDYLGAGAEEVRDYYTSVFSRIESSSSGILDALFGTPALNIANGFWYDEGREVDINQDYLMDIETYYNADVSAIDFSDSDDVLSAINSWCGANTGDRISEIVTADDIKDAVSVVANAIYFEGTWAEKFSDVEDVEFTGFDSSYTIDGMYSTETIYFENDMATAFRKDYDDGFAFIGILPKQEGEFQLSELDIDGLLDTETSAYDVDVMLPKFTADYEAELSDMFRLFGITDAFDKNTADFSCMNDSMDEMPGDMENFFLSKLLHKTYVDINEEGTTAAAVTAGVMELSDARQESETVEVFLDRPFAFLIMDTDTDIILFAGKIVDLK